MPWVPWKEHSHQMSTTGWQPGECLWDTNIPLLDIPEADAAGASRSDQGGHSLPSTPQPAEDAISIVLEGNDSPHEGRNALEAAKTQRNILRDYFMTNGEVPWQMDRI